MKRIIDGLLAIAALVFMAFKRARPQEEGGHDMPKESQVEELNIDLDTVTHQCICGSKVWKLLAAFDDYELAWYSITMYCASCGAKAMAPTPLDRPETSGF